MPDLYKVLGIDTSATPEEVKKAYFEMAKKYHPDSGDESEVRKFHEVAEAYKVLSDENSKQAYDTTIIATESAKIPVEPTFQTVRSKNRAHYRDDELKTFHKNRFKKAIYRMIGFTLVVGLGGYFVSLILGGVGFYGGIAGLFIGLSLSVNKNFKISSFFHTNKLRKIFRVFTWILLIAGFGYFVWLIVKDFAPL